MNKLISKIVGVCLGLSLATGVGVGVAMGDDFRLARATEEVYYTLQPANGSNNSYGGNCDVAISGITWNVNGNSQQQPWRIGGKSLNKVDRTVFSKTAMGSAITKVELTVGAASSITVNSLKLIVASNADFSTVIDTVTETFAANSTITFDPSSDGTNWATGAYYKFVFNVSVSGNNNKFVEFTQAKFYREASAGSKYTVTYDTNGGSGTVVDNTEYDNGATVTVLGIGSVTKAGYTFVNWSDGNGNNYIEGDTFTISANTTLTANWYHDDVISAKQASYEIYTDATLNLTTCVNAVGDGALSFTVPTVPYFTYDSDTSTITADSTIVGGPATITAHKGTASCSFTVSVVTRPSTGTFVLFEDSLEEGDYVVFYNEKAMKAEVVSNRLSYISVTPVDDEITNPDALLIWHIAPDGDYWTLYNEETESYAASTGADSKAQLETSLTDYGRWTVTGTGTYDFVNKGKTGDKNHLRNNGTYGFACYAESTGGALSLYKLPVSRTLDSIAVTGSMEKTEYEVGDSWNPTGLIVTATYDDGFTKNVTSSASWTYSPETATSTSVVSVTATASYTENEVTKSASSTAQAVTVVAARGTEANPYTVAQAIAAISEHGTMENKYTHGIICQVDSYNSTYHSITYWISDDGLTTTKLEVYGGLGLNSAEFASKDDLLVGDVVTICGTLKVYNSIYEYDVNNYQTYFERPTLSAITGLEGSLTAVSGSSSWNLSTLTPKGTISNGMTNVDISRFVTLSTSNVPGTTVGTKSVSVTVTPKTGSVSAETFVVSGEVINASGDLASGRYYLLNSDKTLGLSAEPCTSSSPTAVDITEFNELNAFDVTLVGNSTYEISTTVSGTKYYLVHNSVATSKDNALIRITSEPVSGLKTRYWTLDAEAADTEGAYSVSQNTVGDTIRHLACYDGQDWRGYMTDNGDQDIQFVPEGYYASVVAEMIINDLTCDNGVTPPSVSVWGDIETAYSEITIFNEMVLLVDGTADEESTDIIERALAKYDFVIGKYGSSTYSNFLDRSVSGAKQNISVVGDSNAAVTAILVVMALTVTTAGAYFFLRKKKEEK